MERDGGKKNKNYQLMVVCLGTFQVAVHIHISPDSYYIESVVINWECHCIVQQHSIHMLSISKTNKPVVDYTPSNMDAAAAKLQILSHVCSTYMLNLAAQKINMISKI